jgi:hypothetical protein
VNRIGVTLLILLIAQLALVGRLYWSDHDAGNTAASMSLADIGPFLVDEIRISDAQGDEAVIARRGEKWLLPELGNLPANTARVENLLEQLTQTDPGWSVANTLPARQRFQVAHYHFRRRIELIAQGQKISTVFLGTSPGFRKVHARNEQRDKIYSISLNLFDTSTRDDHWIDGRLLQIRAPLKIGTDRYSIVRRDSDWQMSNGSPPDPRELDALLSALRNLQVEGVASEEERDELAFAEAALILNLEDLGGSTSLELYSLGEKHFIVSARHELPFRLSAYSFDQLTGIDALLLSGAQ